jgi:hypothetical protein
MPDKGPGVHMDRASGEASGRLFLDALGLDPSQFLLIHKETQR